MLPSTSGRKRRIVEAESEDSDVDLNETPEEAERSRPAKRTAPGPSQSPSQTQPTQETQDTQDDMDFERRQDSDRTVSFRATKAEAGIVSSIRVVNFMCHSNFKIDLDPHVNFIVGENGTGKSAVLAALTVALGEKGRGTGRGNNMKDLIKHGEERATVTVTLLNEGEDAYKPEVYGNRIIVERRIPRSGSPSFKIMNHAGKLVSDKRQELNRIIDQFNIQIDNPCCIMTQEMSKLFATTKSAKERYDLFQKATGLKRIFNDLLESDTMIDSMTSTVKEIKENREPALVEEVEQLNGRRAGADKLRKLEKQMNDIVKTEAWRMIKQSEQDLDKQLTFLEDLVKSQETDRTKMNNYQKMADTLKEEKQQILDSTESTKMESEELARKSLKIEETMLALRKEIKVMRKDRKQFARDMAQLEENKNTYTKFINEQAARAGNKNSRLAELNARSAQLRKDKQDIDEKIREAEDRVQRVNDGEVADAEANMHDLETNYKRIEGEVKRQKSDLDGIRGSKKKDPAMNFGGGMRVIEMRKRMAADRRFSRPPMGPLGAYFEVKDKKWAPAIQKQTSPCLEKFICFDHRDIALLKKYHHDYQVQFQGTYVVNQAGRHDISSFRDRIPFTTMYDVIQFDNDYIHNFIVDHFSVERNALLENDEDCRKAIRQNPDLYSAWVPGCRHQFKHGSLMSEVVGNTRVVVRCAGENDHLIPQFEQDLRTKERELAGLADAIKEHRAILKASSQKLHRAKDEVNRLYSALKNADLERENLNNELAEIDSEEDISKYFEDIEQAEKEMDEIKINDKRLEEELNIKLDEFSKIEEEYGEIEKETEAVNEKLEQVGRRVEQVDVNIKKAMEKIRKYHGLVDKANSDILDTEAEVKDQREALEANLNVVTDKFGENRIDVDLDVITEESLAKDMAVVKKCIEKEKAKTNLNSSEDVFGQWQAKTAELKSLKKRTGNVESAADRLKESYNARKQNWFNLRHDASFTLKTEYLRLCNQRSHFGEIKLNHANHELSINMTINGNRGGQNAKDNKNVGKVTNMAQLSGGERSYSTVSYVLALGDTMEVPFRVMDEFDVFMDEVNRKVALSLLMETAVGKQRNRQFIFLTPQALTQSKDTLEKYKGLVKVHRMRPPARNGAQTVLEEYTH